MCRMCIVEIDTGRGPALQPACMIPVAPDMKVDTECEVTKKAQDGVLEFLLINHPLDCPVCDKGGECPLQDQTISYGPGESRFVEEKRHFEKPIPISDLVALDRERCILCDRCTRFADEVAGDPLIHFQDRGNQTAGQHVPRPPVRQLLQRQHRADLPGRRAHRHALPVQGPAVGPRPGREHLHHLLGRLPHARAVEPQRVLRYQGVDVDPVNWGWLCDKGRFGFEAVNSDDRLGAPLVRDGRRAASRSPWGEALSRPPRRSTGGHAPSRVARRSAAPGSPTRAPTPGPSWPRACIGTDNVDAQLGDGLPAEVVLGLPRATIDEACAAGGTVLLLAPDLKEELPVLFLRLRHAVARDGVTVVELGPQRTSAVRPRRRHAAPPPRRGRRGRARAARRRRPPRRSAVSSPTPSPRPARCSPTARSRSCSAGHVAESADGVVAAAAAIHAAHPERAVPPRAAPGQRARRPRHGPGARAAARPRHARRRRGVVHGPRLADGARRARASTPPASSQAAADGKVDVLVLLGADPLADFPDRDLAARALAGARTVIAVDLFLTASAAQADVVLAAAGSAEVDGTTTNLEGRVSTVGQKVTPPGTARADWMIAAELGRLLGADLGLESPAQILEEIAAVAPSHAGLTADVDRTAPARRVLVGRPADAPAPRRRLDRRRPGGRRGGRRRGGRRRRRRAAGRRGRGDRGAGRRGEPTQPPSPEPPAAAPGRLRAPTVGRAPGRRRLLAAAGRHRKLYDLGTVVQHSPSLAGLAGDTVLRLNPYDFDRLGVDAGHRGHRHLGEGLGRRCRCEPDAGVGRGAAAVVLNQPGATVGALIDATAARHRHPGGEGVMLARRPAPRRRHRPRRGRSSSSARSCVTFALLLVSVLFMVWFERKVLADMQNRIGPNRAGPVRHPPDPRRRHQVLLQGGPAARPGRQARVHPRAVPVAGPRLPRVLDRPHRRRLQRRSSRAPSSSSATTPTCSSPTRPSASCSSSPVVDRRLRRDARRLVVGLEVPAARLGAGVGADGLLRGRPRPVGRRRRAARRLAVDPRHRADAGRRRATRRRSPTGT